MFKLCQNLIGHEWNNFKYRWKFIRCWDQIQLFVDPKRWIKLCEKHQIQWVLLNNHQCWFKRMIGFCCSTQIKQSFNLYYFYSLSCFNLLKELNISKQKYTFTSGQFKSPLRSSCDWNVLSLKYKFDIFACILSKFGTSRTVF